MIFNNAGQASNIFTPKLNTSDNDNVIILIEHLHSLDQLWQSLLSKQFQQHSFQVL